MTTNARMDADYITLKPYGCVYLGPDYDPRDAKSRTEPTPYCGCKTLHKDTLYCAEHYELMYVKGSALRKRHKDIKRASNVREIESLFNEILEELEAEGWVPEEGLSFEPQ